jgi:hypothetical protein
LRRGVKSRPFQSNHNGEERQRAKSVVVQFGFRARPEKGEIPLSA